MEAKQEFLDQLATRGLLPPEADVERAATAVLSVLARRLTSGEVAKVVKSLPEEMRGLFDERARHDGVPPDIMGRDQFVRRLKAGLGAQTVGAERFAMATYAALRERLPDDVARGVESQLPADLKGLWRSRLH